MEEIGGGCSGESELLRHFRQNNGDAMVFFKSLERNQRKFQLKMKAIFEKYSHPFHNDVVVDMEDLTFDTPNGRRSWIHDTVEQCSGQMSTASDKRENPDTDDCKGFASAPNSALTVFNKTIDLASPFKTKVSPVKSFIDMNNTNVLLKFPGRNHVAFFKADDCETTHNEETSFSEPGNTTLEDIYPQMIQNMSHIWTIPIKTKAAFNILRYYKHQIRRKQKFMAMKMINRSLNKTYTMYHAPHVEKPVKALDYTLWPNGGSSRSALGDPIESQNPSLALHKLRSPVVSSTHRHISKSNSNKTFEPVGDNKAIYRDVTLPGKLHKKENATALCYPSNAMSELCKMYNILTRIVTNKGQMDVAIAKSSHGKDSRQQHMYNLSRRKSFSGFSVLQSPINKIANANCNMSKVTRSPSSYLTSQSFMATERAHVNYEEHTDHVDRTRSLTRNSFSAFPVGHRPDFTLSKAKVQFSNTISSLVNSPGSVRAKRPLSHDLSFSNSKKPRSMTDVIVNPSKPLSQESPKLSQSNSTLHQSVGASTLPAHMWFQSPESRRLISPRNNDRSSKRTPSRLFRKLTYQEDDN